MSRVGVLVEGKTYGGMETQTNGRLDWNFPDSVQTICHAQLRKPRLRVRIQFARLLVLVHLAEYPNGLRSAPRSRRREDAVELRGMINQSSRFEIAVSRAFSIRDGCCCTCQRHGEGIDVRFIFLWGASTFSHFN